MLVLGDLIKSVVELYAVYPHTDICHTGPNDDGLLKSHRVCGVLMMLAV